jgi:hypothetical protein
MQDYFDWHVKEEARFQANPGDWESFRFLVMRCYQSDNCGGTADRLKSLPLLVLMAANSSRLLLIKWGNPFDLEEFLLPNEINWTVPHELLPVLASAPRGAVATTAKRLDRLISTNATVIGSKLQIPGAYYETDQWKWSPFTHSQTVDESLLLFHDLFRILFRPSPPVAEMVQQELQQISRPYIAAHLRAKYPGEPYRTAEDEQLSQDQKEAILLRSVTQALQCASHLKPKVPIYFAADATQANQLVQQHFHNNRTIRRISTLSAQRASSVHLAFAKLEHPSGYFPIFVDLLMMGNADCVSYGRGGFGQLASYLSYNATCHQFRRSGGDACSWQD